jgi:two-component system response regulator FixJ
MTNSSVVHIVDDDEAVRKSLAFLLSSAGVAVRVYESATAFLASFPDIQQGCLITDVRMPDISGIELLRRLSAMPVSMPAIVITGHGDIALAVEAMKAGAVDFIEKPFNDEAILRAVQAACDKLDRAVGSAEYKREIDARAATLSTRERQVLDGLVAGQPNKIIAHELGISPRTVEVYRANLMTKMQANSLSDLVRMALVLQAPDGGSASKI